MQDDVFLRLSFFLDRLEKVSKSGVWTKLECDIVKCAGAGVEFQAVFLFPAPNNCVAQTSQ